MEPLLWLFIFGGFFGWLAGEMTKIELPWGVAGNIIAGIIGAWLGIELLGRVGPTLIGIHIIPAFVGALLFVLMIGWIIKNTKRK